MLGFETEEEEITARARPVERLRGLVHGHWPVREVETTLNRWNIDTGAGHEALNRLSLLQVNARGLRVWTFDVDDPVSLVVRLPPRLRAEHDRTEPASPAFPRSCTPSRPRTASGAMFQSAPTRWVRTPFPAQERPV